jgi:hypothetical protein
MMNTIKAQRRDSRVKRPKKGKISQHFWRLSFSSPLLLSLRLNQPRHNSDNQRAAIKRPSLSLRHTGNNRHLWHPKIGKPSCTFDSGFGHTTPGLERAVVTLTHWHRPTFISGPSTALNQIGASRSKKSHVTSGDSSPFAASSSRLRPSA